MILSWIDRLGTKADRLGEMILSIRGFNWLAKVFEIILYTKLQMLIGRNCETVSR